MAQLSIELTGKDEIAVPKITSICKRCDSEFKIVLNSASDQRRCNCFNCVPATSLDNKKSKSNVLDKNALLLIAKFNKQKHCKKCNEIFYVYRYSNGDYNNSMFKLCANCNPSKNMPILNTITCPICKKTRSTYKTIKSNIGVCVRCSDIARKYAIKKQCVEYKGGICEHCGENRQWLLDFHHIDPNSKDFILSDRQNYKFETLKPEMDKCLLLCANCHRNIHKDMGEIEKVKAYLDLIKNGPPQPEHLNIILSMP